MGVMNRNYFDFIRSVSVGTNKILCGPPVWWGSMRQGCYEPDRVIFLQLTEYSHPCSVTPTTSPCHRKCFLDRRRRMREKDDENHRS